jgi:hypothetical protein
VAEVAPGLADDLAAAIAACNVCDIEVTPSFGSASVGETVQLAARVRCGQDQRVTWRVSPAGASVGGGAFVAARGGNYVVTVTSVANAAMTGAAYVSVDCSARDFVGSYAVVHQGWTNNSVACPGYFGGATLKFDYADGGASNEVEATYNYAGYLPDGRGKCELKVLGQISGCSVSGTVGPAGCSYVELAASLSAGKPSGFVAGRIGPSPCVLNVEAAFQGY